jgi:hypothetical protein
LVLLNFIKIPYYVTGQSIVFFLAHNLNKMNINSTQKKASHFLNMTNFEHLVTICKSYDSLYNPTKTNYSISELDLLCANSKSVLAKVSSKELAYSMDTNERELLFNDLKHLSTRILMGFKSVGATKVHLDDLAAINRKIQGRRAVAITEEEKTLMALQLKEKEAGTVVDPNVKQLKKNSVSQLSFERLIDNFSKLIELAKVTTEYNPNEVDLKVNALIDKLAAMVLANQVVSQSTINLTNARFERDNLFYLQENNLVDTAMAVKNYSRSVFGTRNIQNKQLTALSFNRITK